MAYECKDDEGIFEVDPATVAATATTGVPPQRYKGTYAWPIGNSINPAGWRESVSKIFWEANWLGGTWKECGGHKTQLSNVSQQTSVHPCQTPLKVSQ